MSSPHGIIIFGANGSGKTTLGRELARILNYKHMDIEDYHFEKTEIPYTVERSGEDRLKLMLADIEKHRSFIITAVTGDFGETITQFYELAIFLSAPLELRMERIKQRMSDQYGERVNKGGDMYEQTSRFFDFAASRPLSGIDKWAETLKCPVIHIDGTINYRLNAENIAKEFFFTE